MAPKGIKFLHCADIHLDIPFCDHGKEGYSEMRKQDVRKTFEGIIKLSREEKVDFVLISGDLYEHGYTSKSSVEWIESLLRSLSVPVVIIPGNHDPFVANSWYAIREWPENVIVLSNEHPSIKFNSLNTFIYGIGFSAFRQDKPDLSGVSRPDPDCFNILLLHGTLDMDIGKPYNPVTSLELGAMPYDYYALGHFHNRITDFKLKNAVNPGSPEPLGFDEKGPHGVLIVTLELSDTGEKSLKMEERNIAQREYVEFALDITQCKSVDEIRQRIADLLKDTDAERDLVRIILKGRAGCEIDCEALEESFLAGRRYFKIRNETRLSFNYEALVMEETLKGAFVRELLLRIKRCEENGDDVNLPILTAALDFGTEALEYGRIDTRID